LKDDVDVVTTGAVLDKNIFIPSLGNPAIFS
jgi:hypothetical protein